jgi:hypothetical protein
MGAWGPKAFENDVALDWAAELEEFEDYAAVSGALDAVMQDKADHLDADVCEEGVAAAEIVAAGAGKPAGDLPDDIKNWLAGKPKPDAALVTQSLGAIAAIREKSELKELWEDSDDLAAWTAAMDDLNARLSAVKTA